MKKKIRRQKNLLAIVCGLQGFVTASLMASIPPLSIPPTMPTFNAYTMKPANCRAPENFDATNAPETYMDYDGPITSAPLTCSACGSEPINTNCSLVYTSEEGSGCSYTADTAPVPFATPTYANCTVPLMYSQPNLYPLVVTQSHSISIGTGSGDVNVRAGYLANAGYAPSTRSFIEVQMAEEKIRMILELKNVVNGNCGQGLSANYPK